MMTLQQEIDEIMLRVHQNTKSIIHFLMLKVHEAHMHTSCSRLGSHEDEISVLGFLFSLISQHNNGRNVLHLGKSDCLGLYIVS